MRRAIAALVATVAGLVLLLSFKSGSAKSTSRPVALSGTAAGSGENSAPPPSSAPPASPPASSSDGAAPSSEDPTTPTAQPTQPAQPTQAPTTAPAAKPSSKPSTQTITGTSVQVSEGFRTFGNVQVRVTLTNGKITNLVAVDYPNNDPRSSEISQYSIPVLGQEVLAAQGTKIDVVSGATYTSDAYAQSVQAALDKAKS